MAFPYLSKPDFLEDLNATFDIQSRCAGDYPGGQCLISRLGR